MGDHALFSPSATSRWLNCVASVIPDGENRSSPDAERGTLAHLYLEAVLKNEVFLEPIDPVDRAAVEEAAEYVRSIPHDEMFVEVRLMNIDYFIDFWGTADVVLLDHENRMVHILDYKNGAGVFVNVNFNKQLLSYAVLFISMYPDYANYLFGLHILQPKRRNLSSMVVSGMELDEHCKAIKFALSEYYSSPKLAANPGDWCKWCPRAFKSCPAHLITKDLT